MEHFLQIISVLCPSEIVKYLMTCFVWSTLRGSIEVWQFDTISTIVCTSSSSSFSSPCVLADRTPALKGCTNPECL